jgi:hypothetical protein
MAALLELGCETGQGLLFGMAESGGDAAPAPQPKTVIEAKPAPSPQQEVADKAAQALDKAG